MQCIELFVDPWIFKIFSASFPYTLYMAFLHNRPWISPWIKSISNELDITIHVIASQLSGHCDVISNRLWSHQQNENRASETQRRCVKIVVFIIIYGFLMSCKKYNNIYPCYFGVYFYRCFATREINTKITLWWVLKQFVKRVHTLFSIFSMCHHCNCGMMPWVDCWFRHN